MGQVTNHWLSYSINEYMEDDANLFMHKTIKESNIINNLTVSKVPENNEEDDNNENCLYKPYPTPFVAW